MKKATPLRNRPSLNIPIARPAESGPKRIQRRVQAPLSELFRFLMFQGYRIRLKFTAILHSVAFSVVFNRLHLNHNERLLTAIGCPRAMHYH
jgi:hypothetical protein